jgi:hypothetical protein
MLPLLLPPCCHRATTLRLRWGVRIQNSKKNKL